jgi:uncharacterized OB-fold protein
VNSDGSDIQAHSAPGSNRDYDFFFAGLERGELLAQRCGGCGKLRNPPSPACPHCHSQDWTAEAISGRGTIYSYMIHHHPPLPSFGTPHPIAIADMEEGIRFLAAMDGTAPDAMAIGRQVSTEFLRRDGVASFRFRLVEKG